MREKFSPNLVERLCKALLEPNDWESCVYKQQEIFKFSTGQKDVFIAWGILLEEDPKELPLISKVAHYAVCSEKTVKRALKNGQIFGLLDKSMKPVIGSGS